MLPRASDALPTTPAPIAPPAPFAHAHTEVPTSVPSIPSNSIPPPSVPSHSVAPTRHFSGNIDSNHLPSSTSTHDIPRRPSPVREGKYSSYFRAHETKRSRSRERSPPRTTVNPLQKAMQTLGYDSGNTVGRAETNHWKRFLQGGPNSQGLSHLQQQWLRDFPIYEESRDLTIWLSDLETRLPTGWDVWAKVSILHQRLNAKHQHLFAAP